MDVITQTENFSWVAELIDFAAAHQIYELQHLEKNPLQVVMNLQTLDLSYKELSCLPDALSRLTELKHLDLSHNRFEVFPPQVFTLESLTSLDISWNHIIEIPNSLPRRLTINRAWNRSKSNK
ncbi:hypothetical protein [Sulfurimonas sp. HSL3-7]|uniref:leucine-rich repeat domain-containing protein n=1 Tax=Sulfonitrofixus jiaomeiensis TaxID=3131938 RepID=UPI0031F8E870